jgi:putative transposase
MKYHRVYINGATYFFTLVTHNRKSIFNTIGAVELFNDAITYTNQRMPFKINAYVVLPDHLHSIWTLPENSSDYSTRWRLIKSYFTRHWLVNGTISKSPSKMRSGEQDVWQRRFWEHLIRDEKDLARHVEYIHYNPVKHSLVNSPIEWKYSSFIEYVQEGLYPVNWGENLDLWPGIDYME